MLDVLKNIDTVNYIIQEGMKQALIRPLEFRSGFFNGDGFGVDIIKGKGSNSMNFRIRTSYLQTLCTVYMEKDCFTLRYGPQFILKVKTKNGMVSTNLFDDSFELSEMESTFFVQNTIGFGIPLTVDFDFDTMIETIKLCWSVHASFISFIQTKNT